MADNLIIKIGGSVKGYTDALKEAQEKTEDLGNVVDEVGKVAALAFAATSTAIGLAVNEFAEAEKVANRTNNIIQATGGIAGVTAKEVSELAASLQKTTTFSDEAVQSAENILLTFTNIGKNVFPQATKSTLDLATRLGVDASSAAETLGKALQDPEQGLSRLTRAGIVFTDAQKAQIKAFQDNNDIASAQKVIMDQLAGTIGGLATGEVNSLSGSMAQARNAISDAAEIIGAQFAPFAKKAADVIRDLANAFKENEQTVKALAAGLAVIAAASGVTVVIVGITKAVIALEAALAAGSIALSTIVPVFAAVAAITTLAAAAWKTYTDEQKKSEDATKNFVNASMEAEQFAIKKYQRERQAEIEEENAKKAHLLKVQSEEIAANNARREHAEEAHNLTMLSLQGFNQEYINQMKALNDLELAMALEKSPQKIAIMREQYAVMKQDFVDYTTEMMIAREEVDKIIDTKVDEKNQELISKDQKLYNTLLADASKYQLTEKTAKEKFLQEEIRKEVESNNLRLMEAQKYGKAYAEFQYALRSTEVGQSATFFSTMQNMTTSHNSILKGIGKAAALTKIGIDTATAAMQAYGAFPIPFIGPALGAAAAAAIIAFGAEQAGRVMAAADGGLLTGGRYGVDSIPMLGMPGELVVPTKNFEEVINAMVSQRTGQPAQAVTGGDSSGGGTVRVMIELNEDASQIITARQIEDESLGISRVS